METKNILIYISTLIFLLIAANIYFKIAVYFNIIDAPNKRSSHTTPTIRGGGILFYLSLVLFFLWNNLTLPYLLLAVTLSAFISFIDDIIVVNNTLKFSIQIISLLLIFMQCDLLFTIKPLYLVAIGIIIIGIINAYNFMDGINGITGLYSFGIILSLLLTEQHEVLKSLQLFLLIGLLVFNFYNVRTKARCFAGDVGSISMALLIIFLLIMRIQETDNYIYIGLLLLYGIDSVYTILQRLYQKENIFLPHRKHLYQYYCNEQKTPHVIVSLIYSIIQLCISLAIVYGYLSYVGLLFVFILLSCVYWFFKIRLIRAFSRQVV